MTEESQGFLRALDASITTEQMLILKGTSVPKSLRKVPRLADSAATKPWHWNQKEAKKRRKMQKRSRRINRQRGRRG